MEIEGLRKWRFKAPGIIAGLCAAPLAWHFGLLEINEKLLGIVLVPGFGAIVSWVYQAVDFRGSLWRHEMNEYVGKQIRETMLGLIPPTLCVTEGERKRLSEREVIRKLTGVFWEAIDADEQLRGHKESFYNNGKDYTTALDIFIICGLSGYLYLFGLSYEIAAFYIIWSAIFLTISLIAWHGFVPLFRRRHMELSREQLDQLKRKQEAFVQSNFERLVSEMRSGRNP